MLTTEQPPSSKPTVFFILGGPGAGKGTLCDSLVRELGFHHFSTGDLLRRELAENPFSEYSSSIKTHISEGSLVPSRLLLSLLEEKIKQIKENDVKILLDGFPRNMENLDVWKGMALDEEFDVKMALFLDCCFETMESNVLERAKTSGRSDDNLEIIRKRIKVFETQTRPIIEHLEREEKIVRLDAEKSPEHIFREVKGILRERKILSV